MDIGELLTSGKLPDIDEGWVFAFGTAAVAIDFVARRYARRRRRIKFRRAVPDLVKKARVAWSEAGFLVVDVVYRNSSSRPPMAQVSLTSADGVTFRFEIVGRDGYETDFVEGLCWAVATNRLRSLGQNRPAPDDGPEMETATAPTPSSQEGWWTILEVGRDATRREIDAAWRRLSMTHHPDRPGGSEERMKALTQARDKGRLACV